MRVLCRVEGQAGQLGVLELEGIGGAFQLWAELGSLVHLSLLLSLQLPLPLTELMENEALEILTEALRSEPPHPLLPAPPPTPNFQKRPWGTLQALVLYEWGFMMCLPIRFPYHPQIFQKL